jgi:non-ribosomal peptide synthetase component E (peptide arylation enzyme)
LTLESLNRQLVEAGVARFMLPERLELVDALPRNTTGKVPKRECVEVLLARARERETN